MDPGSIATAIDVVQRAIAIYKRIEGLPKQMSQLGQRMEALNLFLVPFGTFVKQKPDSAYSRLFPGQKEALGKLLSNINEHTAKVYDLFERYEKGILSRSHDLQFRVRWAAQVWFSLVDNSPEKIQAIMEDIDFDRRVLSDYMALMNVRGVEVIVNKVLQPPGQNSETVTGQTATAQAVTGQAVTGQAVTAQATMVPRNLTPVKRPSPSPSPSPPRKDFKILFVDPYNQGRSVAAEALTKLLAQATTKANGNWRILLMHSAGFFVKNGCDCVGIIEGLNYSYKSFKMDFEDTAKKPYPMAMDAVFDNKSYNHPFKNDIRDMMNARRSRGLRKNTFDLYDYIIVFTYREHDNMIKLKEALQNRLGGPTPVPRKGRVLHLGAYLTGPRGGPPREIGVPKKVNGNPSRAAWNQKVAEIKTALKGFLKQEMKWSLPDTETTG